jgi:signal transduction histidine kinase
MTTAARKAITPTFVLIIAILLSVVYNLVFPLRGFEYDILVFYGFISVVAFVLLVVFQRFIYIIRIHLPLSLGWGMVFIAGIEKLNSEYLDTIWPGYENEDFFTALLGIGLGIIAIGFYSWMSYNRQQDQLRDQQHKMIELYTSLMSHDARNDLQAILGYIETALLVPDGCSPKTLELLEAAKASALRMTSLIKAFKPEVTQVETRLVSILTMSSLQAEKAHIGLTINIEAAEETNDIEVAGGSILQMAFANLFRNSAEYAGENPTISISVKIDRNDAIIMFSDSGPGISEEFKDNMFKRGVSGEGHGFGLYLTRQIVAACGGTIELVESGTGAEFKITLPISH